MAGNKKIEILLIVVNLLTFDLCLILSKYPAAEPPPVTTPIVHTEPTPPVSLNYELKRPIPGHLSYDNTIKQLELWHEQAPELTQISVYGKSAKDTDLYYMRVTNPHKQATKSVLITACIHGNEPLSSSVVMAYLGTLLDKYGDDPQITELLDTRVLYFVPIVSPDSYPNSRHVNGVDPNRNFPTSREAEKQSVAPVQALRELFLKIKPAAVWSGHTSGRIFLIPYGERTDNCPNDGDYRRIVGKMGELSGYRIIKACQLYGRPIYGTETDWYYRNGAFAIVTEYGTIQRPASAEEVAFEHKKTFDAFLCFLKESPEVEIKQSQPPNFSSWSNGFRSPRRPGRDPNP